MFGDNRKVDKSVSVWFTRIFHCLTGPNLLSTGALHA